MCRLTSRVTDHRAFRLSPIKPQGVPGPRAQTGPGLRHSAQLAIVDDDVLDRFEVDTIELGRGFALDDADWVDWTLPDGSPCQVPVWTLPERVDQGWVMRSKTGRVIAQMPDGALVLRIRLLSVGRGRA